VAIHFYVVPKIGDGVTGATAFSPKYFAGPVNPSGLPFAGALDYGLEDLFLVVADLDAGQHTTLNANGDVLAVPSLANTVGAALATVQSKLEAKNVPADWVTAGMTYQQVLARVIRLVGLMQRFHGMFGRLFIGGLTLNSTISQIPAGARTRLATAAQSMGAVTTSITGATTIRAALVIVADQLQTGGLTFGGVTF